MSSALHEAITPDPREHIEPRKVRYYRRVDDIPNIPERVREELREVEKRYVFRVNDYYLELIDWDDPKDPIKQLIIPRVEELKDWGQLDASNEAAVTVARGVQHKYHDTVLLLCNEVCGAYCRYCFRKRLFMNENDEVSLDISDGLAYIARHSEVTNVLLTGGDPLLMSTRRLTEILEELRAIPHVKIIRLGTKMPAFNPWRTLGDPKLLELIRKHSTAHRRIYIMTHFDHPRELTPAALAGIDALKQAGAETVNQCPLIKGVNDNVQCLTSLFAQLSFIGCSQYYVFQGRPTQGNDPYKIPIVRAYNLFSAAVKSVSGLAKRARFIMSHATGKIEVVGVDDEHLYMRYHHAKNVEDEGRFMTFRRDDTAFWFDQLAPV